jgi:hypothetical protein
MYLRKLLSLFLIGFSVNTYSLSDDELFYVYDASRFFSLESCMYLSILLSEGGESGFDTHHANGEVDTGIAQINKGGVWMQLIEREYGIKHKKLRDNGSVNILFGGLIFSKLLHKTNDEIEAISAYHRGYGNRRDSLGLAYASKVIQRYSKILSTHECRNHNYRNLS